MIQTGSSTDLKAALVSQNKIGIQHRAGTLHGQGGPLANMKRIAHIKQAGKLDAVDIELEDIKVDSDIGALFNRQRAGGYILAERHGTFAGETHIIPLGKRGGGIRLIGKGFCLSIPVEVGTMMGEVLWLCPGHTAPHGADDESSQAAQK